MHVTTSKMSHNITGKEPLTHNCVPQMLKNKEKRKLL